MLCGVNTDPVLVTAHQAHFNDLNPKYLVFIFGCNWQIIQPNNNIPGNVIQFKLLVANLKM